MPSATSTNPLHPTTPPLRLTTSAHLSTRLLLSTLTGTPIRISQIRPHSTTSPGLAPHEVSLLRLLDSITNGSHIEFSLTGTTLLYRPGLITGGSAGASVSGMTSSGRTITHVLPASNTRGASYFLSVLALLAPFSTAPFDILLTGPGCITTSTPHDISTDTFRTAMLPLLARFAIERNIELRILRRSGPGRSGAGGAGEVRFLAGHQVRLPKTVHLLSPGKVRRIRGVAYATGVGGSANARAIEAARGVLNALCGDVYVYSDVGSAPFAVDHGDDDPRTRKHSGSAATTGPPKTKRKTGISHGLSLTAETSSGTLYSSDACTPPSGGIPAEEVGRDAALRLLEEVERGGCVEASGLRSVMVLMGMGSEDVGRVRLGRGVVGSEEFVGLAREVRKFGGASWGVRDVRGEGEGGGDGDGDVVVSVVGRGVGNVGRKIA